SRFAKGGFRVGASVFVLFATVIRPGVYHDPVNNEQALRTTYRTFHRHVNLIRRATVVGNSEAVGMALYRDYLVPFEVASIFLLVAMIGAIVIGKRELSALEEETAPDFILEKVETEKEVKEAMSASTEAYLMLSGTLFAVGLIGVIIRRNMLT